MNLSVEMDLPLTFVLSPEAGERKCASRIAATRSSLLSPWGRGQGEGVFQLHRDGLIWIGGTGVPACDFGNLLPSHRQGRLCHHYSLNFRHYRGEQ